MNENRNPTTTELWESGLACKAIRAPDGQIHIANGTEHHDEIRERLQLDSFSKAYEKYSVPMGMNPSYFVRTNHDGLVYEGEFFSPADLDRIPGGLIEAFALRQSNTYSTK